MNIINYLKIVGYDYLALAKGDGVTDDSFVIQQRIDAGLMPLKGGEGKTFLCSKAIHIGDNCLFDGRAT